MGWPNIITSVLGKRGREESLTLKKRCDGERRGKESKREGEERRLEDAMLLEDGKGLVMQN